MVEVFLNPLSRNKSSFGPTVSGHDSSQPSYFQTHDYSSLHHSKSSDSRGDVDTRVSMSISSSAPSSPQTQHNELSSPISCLSTPSSLLSLNDYCSDEEDSVIKFPRFNTEEHRADNEPPPSPSTGDGQEGYHCSGNTTIHAEVVYQSAGDDTALIREPSRHVDYLSHDWREEDIWCSWRHIVSRRNQLDNSQRLENAAWRTWAKCRGCLKTVSPEKLNWMKDHDVTWLYGPLQTVYPQSICLDSLATNADVSRGSSFLYKKPILKKHSMSEIMLRRSLSNSTLVRQAVDALADQGRSSKAVRMRLDCRSESERIISSTPTFRKQMIAEYSPKQCSSTATSGVHTPGTEKHIHFNNEVEQCIAINKEIYDGDDYDNLPLQDEVESESSDDGVFMMRMDNLKERKYKHVNTAPISITPTETGPSKIIAMLPSTTLKYRSDTPEPPVQSPHPEPDVIIRPPKLIHSPSSETLRPARPSSNFLVADDDEASNENWVSFHDMNAHHRLNSRSQSSFSFGECLEEDEDMHNRGLRRTPSGMLMPYDEGEDTNVGGLFTKVLDTVNTARDIAHVIWNVGWRR